ncbi:MAG: MotA/TolQ/ExbB proton channel family protein [Pirellulales bacterium]|nr:MotA/TolQ/ExbB proton channel family protein [Pirellulales bacterium]
MRNRSMFANIFGSLSKRVLLVVLLASALFYAAMVASRSTHAQSQDDMGPVGRQRMDKAFNDDKNNEADSEDAAAISPPKTNREKIGTQRMIELMFDENSRWLMLPIALFALISLVFGVERVIAIRRGRILPSELVAALGEASRSSGGLDPRKAYKICQQYASTASNVIRAALLKVGRPHSEVEHTVKEASEREADKLYANVRPLNLAAGVTPLLGLLGTVFGMIQAFAQTASGAVATNKAEQLAEGIYTALVTTFAGLTVAIPAAVLAHWLEGRIQANFREIDELLLNMLPQLEQYEGKLRLRRGEGAEEGERTSERSAPKATIGKNGAAPTAAAPERKRK